jgi:hypothetical protein
MTATTALLRSTVKPHIAAMAEAIHADAATLAAEWSRGDQLSMLGHGTVAGENTARILILAAAAALNDAGDSDMAGLLESYLRGRAAEMQFANRDRWTVDALETGAADVEGLAERIAERFRADAGRVAA